MKLAHIETELRRSQATSRAAILQDLSDPHRLDYLTTVLSYLQRQVEYMGTHMLATLIELTTARCLGYLTLSDLDPEFKRDLRQPWSATLLFNGQVAKTHARVSASRL